MWKDKNILFFFNPTPTWNLNSPSPFSSLFFLLSFPFLPLHQVQYFPSSNFIFKILREGKPWPPVEGNGKLEEREGQDRRITISVWCEGYKGKNVFWFSILFWKKKEKKMRGVWRVTISLILLSKKFFKLTLFNRNSYRILL